MKKEKEKRKKKKVTSRATLRELKMKLDGGQKTLEQ